VDLGPGTGRDFVVAKIVPNMNPENIKTSTIATTYQRLSLIIKSIKIRPGAASFRIPGTHFGPSSFRGWPENNMLRKHGIRSIRDISVVEQFNNQTPYIQFIMMGLSPEMITVSCAPL
jgi:hypothetical protein